MFGLKNKTLLKKLCYFPSVSMCPCMKLWLCFLGAVSLNFLCSGVCSAHALRGSGRLRRDQSGPAAVQTKWKVSVKQVWNTRVAAWQDEVRSWRQLFCWYEAPSLGLADFVLAGGVAQCPVSTAWIKAHPPWPSLANCLCRHSSLRLAAGAPRLTPS